MDLCSFQKPQKPQTSFPDSLEEWEKTRVKFTFFSGSSIFHFKTFPPSLFRLNEFPIEFIEFTIAVSIFPPYFLLNFPIEKMILYFYEMDKLNAFVSYFQDKNLKCWIKSKIKYGRN